MGEIWAKLWKKPSTIDILEGIDKEIDDLSKLKYRDGQIEKQYAGSLVMWSVVVYLGMFLFFYFYYVPTTWVERLCQISPLLLFPVLVWAIRKVLMWYFVKRRGKKQLKLEELRDKKKKILEDVKETESYKKAKEILDRFDPAPKPKPVSPNQTPLGVPVPRLRQRPMTARGGRTPNTPRSPPRQPGLTPNLTPQQQLMLRTPAATARPILPRERGTFDKLVDMVVGDGPSSRYALICKHCYSHNGMAMQEEFEYLAFKCAYCSTFNPSRKVRPKAPQLPVASPTITQGPPRNARDSAGSAGTPSGSEDNQSDTETVGRTQQPQPTSIRESASEDDEIQATPASKDEAEASGEPSESNTVADPNENEPLKTENTAAQISEADEVPVISSADEDIEENSHR